MPLGLPVARRPSSIRLGPAVACGAGGPALYGKTPRKIDFAPSAKSACSERLGIVVKNRCFYLRSMLWSGSNYGGSMKRAVLYLRVSTTDQTTANQERELREVASRMGCEIVRVYKDHGISGAKARDKRPEFDRLLRDAAQRKFDMVMAWSVDRLGR